MMKSPVTTFCFLLLVDFVSFHSVLAEQIEVASPSVLWLTDQAEVDRVYPMDEQLIRVLSRVGPNMRASSDYHDYRDVKLNESINAWQVFHEKSKKFAQNQVHFYKPKIESLLKAANVSNKCQEAALFVLDSMKNLDAWPIQMWSSTGSFPPAGLLDGQFSDLGSYRGCVDLTIPGKEGEEATSLIKYTSYCSFGFRPIIPSRPHFHQIFELVPEKLLNTFNRTDYFRKVLEKAQFFHYLYVKTGVCVPYQCTAKDMQQVASVLSNRLALQAGPVKCFTRAPPVGSSSSSSNNNNNDNNNEEEEADFNMIENKPITIRINLPMNQKQVVAAILIGSFFGLVILSTVWHLTEYGLCNVFCCTKFTDQYDLERHEGVGGGGGGEEEEEEEENDYDRIKAQQQQQQQQQQQLIEYSGLKHIAVDYFSLLTNGKDFVDTSMRSNEIKCLHGLRVLTMCWIITVHTLQYNEWSGFTRSFDIVPTLQNPLLHPIYNANYVVDNFFFMSGLLVTYTTCCSIKGSSKNHYSILTNLIKRYLRLTPQVFLISLLYILLPLAGNSPFWYDMTHQASKNCENNWWINLLHLQSFYRTEQICNLVSWWISIDMFYYVLAVFIVYLILNNQHKQALLLTLIFVCSCILLSAYRHYIGKYTPNNLGTVPQIGEVWSSYVIHFFFSPFPHAYPFYSGFWIGYILAANKWREQVRKWSRLGWTLALSSMFTILMSSHLWMNEYIKLGDQSISTAYNNICTIIWSSSFAWLVVACHYGCAPTLNKLLGIKLFVLLSKASFIIYLSHMLLVRLYFGIMNTLLEVSVFTLVYAIIGNTFIAGLFGVFLCISFEGPCMKFQKFIVDRLKKTGNSNNRTLKSASYSIQFDLRPGLNGTKTIEKQQVNGGTVMFGPTANVLLK